nr:hypothetical protein [Tanacetum cinerariifolium]
MTTPTVTSSTDSQMHNNIMVAGSRDRPPILATGPYKPTVTSSTDSQMHNNIMVAGSRDRPSILATERYPQWRSRFLRYIDTRPNVAATDDSPATPEHMTLKKCGKLLKGYNKYKNNNQSGQFGNQWTMNVAGARNAEKDFAYHKEKMLLCKQAEQGVPLQAEKYDWIANTDEEIDEQELEAHYSYIAKIQEVPTADSGTDSEPLEQAQNDVEYNVFANDLKHSEQSEYVSNTCLVETDDSNVIPDSPDICDNDIQNNQNDVESDDERVSLANLITNLKLDTEFKKYKAFNDRTVDYDKLELKLNETLGQVALKDIEIKEGLKTKAYEISVVKEKHDELIKQSLLTKSHYEGLVKQKTKVITDLKFREEHDIDKMLSMEKQLKFLNEMVYKRRQSIQTIHMMAPKVPTYNGRPTFANPKYLKQTQSEIPCLYAFPYDQCTHANRLIPDGEETLALERKSRSKLNKDLVCPNDYTTLNGLYEIFKPPTQEFEIQLAHANEIRKKIW